MIKLFTTFLYIIMFLWGYWFAKTYSHRNEPKEFKMSLVVLTILTLLILVVIKLIN